jgi:chemotaxis protein methyltransferase CheR
MADRSYAAILDGAELDVEHFRLIRELIRSFCGISFGDDSRYLVERRLRERLDIAGVQDFGEYYRYLRYHASARSELEEAVEALTTNETYFFREDYQLRAFRDEVLPDLERRNRDRRRLTIWSAGCSTGEEVYTIAMLILESGLCGGWDLRVFGNDVNRRVIAQARRGVYGSSALRATSPERRSTFFVEERDGLHVTERVRTLAHFGHLNLLDAERIALVGRVDAIFCRNVLIYFEPETRRRVLELFWDRLAPGGYLLLGHAESLINFSTSFEIAHLKEDLVYRKPGGVGG